MKNLIVGLAFVLVTSMASAQSSKIKFETFEVDRHEFSPRGSDVAGSGSGDILPLPPISRDSYRPRSSGADQIGQVISTARDIVALGESIYDLVKKGKPSNTTEYAPISVVPRDPISKEIVDPFEMENCSFPTEKKFVTSIKNGRREVVRFEYMIIYSHSCSYNGTGHYIQSASIIPVSVKTKFGWDFTASMKLSGIMNHGTKADPSVGAMLTIKYQMNSWASAYERNDTIHITGRGQLKTYSR